MSEHTARIVGIRFRPGAHDTLLATPGGSAVALRRDPGNAHDPNAIECWIGRMMVGFIPRDRAAELAPLIDAAGEATATLRNYNELTITIASEAPEVENVR